jgi:hypothetical protein
LKGKSEVKKNSEHAQASALRAVVKASATRDDVPPPLKKAGTVSFEAFPPVTSIPGADTSKNSSKKSSCENSQISELLKDAEVGLDIINKAVLVD